MSSHNEFLTLVDIPDVVTFNKLDNLECKDIFKYVLEMIVAEHLEDVLKAYGFETDNVEPFDEVKNEFVRMTMNWLDSSCYTTFLKHKMPKAIENINKKFYAPFFVNLLGDDGELTKELKE